MPPESWYLKATTLVGGEVIFWGITIATVLGLISLIVGIVLEIIQICHSFRNKKDQIPLKALENISHLAIDHNTERKDLAEANEKTTEENEKLKKEITTLRDQLDKQKATSEKEQALTSALELLKHIQKEHSELSDNYIEAKNQQNIETQRALVEKIHILNERDFDYAIVRRFGEISERVKNMSEDELKLEIETFERLMEGIKKDTEHKSYSKKTLAQLLADAKRKAQNNHSGNKDLAKELAEAKRKNQE